MALDRSYYEFVSKNNVAPPLLQKEIERRKQKDQGRRSILPSTVSPIQQRDEDLDRSIGNYQQRIGAVGGTLPEPPNEKKTNLFFKTLDILDRPRNAIVNAMHKGSGKSAGEQFQHFKDGLAGRERVTGSQLLEEQGVENKAVKFVGGVAIDALTDPLTYLTLGLGSLAKGALTGTGKTLTKQGANAVTKTMLGRVGMPALKEGAEELAKASAQQIAKETLTKLGRELTEESVEKAARQIMTAKAKKLGMQSAITGGDDALNIIKKTTEGLTTKALDTNAVANSMGKGVSVGGKTLGGLTNARMQDIGAAASQKFVEKGGILGKGLGELQQGMRNMFNPVPIADLTGVERTVFKQIADGAKGSRRLADEQLLRSARELKRLAGDEEKLIVQVMEGTLDASNLSENARKVVDHMRKDFDRWGFKEKDLDILKHVMDENYFPHVQNWDNMDLKRSMKLGGMTEKIKMHNPHELFRKYGNDVASGNRKLHVITSSKEMQEEFLEQAMRTATDEAKELFAKTKNVWDLNPTNFNMLDGVENYFETSAIKAYVSRGLSHNKIIADKQFLDDIFAGFGDKIGSFENLEKITRDGRDVVIPKSVIKLYKLDTDQFLQANRIVNETAAVKKAVTSAVKEGGAGAVDDATKQAVGSFDGALDKLSRKHGKLLGKFAQETPEQFVKLSPEEFAQFAEYAKDLKLVGKHLPVEAYAMPKGTIDYLQESVKRQTNAGFKTLTNVIDSFHRVWKPSVTGMRPDYYARNTVGSTANNMLDIGFKTLDPAINSAGWKVAKGGDDIIELAGHKLSARQIKDGMLGNNALSNFLKTDADNLTKAIAPDIAGVSMRKPIDAINAVSSKAGSFVEDRVRAVNFVANLETALEKGMDLQSAMNFAGEQVRKFHFDYTDLTHIEKQLFRRVAPFYSWSRKNIPLQLESFLNDPRLYKGIQNVQNNIADTYDIDMDSLPAWAQRELPIPMPMSKGKGSGTMASLSLPMADIARLGSGEGIGKTALGMLSPMLKYPMETATNRQVLTGAPVHRYPEEKMKKNFMNALGQFGVVRDVANLVSPEEKGDRTLTEVAPRLPAGGFMKDFNAEAGRVDNKYAYSRRLGNRIQYMQEQGKNVPDMDTLNWIKKNHPQYLPMIEQTGLIPPILLRKKARR